MEENFSLTEAFNSEELPTQDNTVKTEVNSGILVKLELNPVQFMALRETVISPKFINEMNETVRKVNEGAGLAGFFTDLFSGDYAGTLNELKPLDESEESINHNIGVLLVNLFMSHVLTGGSVELNSPINKRVIRDFLKEGKSGEYSLGY